MRTGRSAGSDGRRAEGSAGARLRLILSDSVREVVAGWRLGWLNRGVRRWCAALLLGVYGLLVGMPLLAMARGPESRLPACCRRAGAHHCAMGMAGMAQGGSGVSDGSGAAEAGGGARWMAPVERCPMWPVPVQSPRGIGFDAVLGAQPGFAVAVCHPGSVVQASSRRRIARERSRHKRGPPSGLTA